MNRAGWNPTKRNRNIGTEEQGKGQNNRLVIPRTDRQHHYCEILNDPVADFRDIGGHRIKFLVEPTSKGYIHSCTVDDIAEVLSHVPPDDIEGIGLIVFRQPTKKQKLLYPWWGSIIYEAEIGNYSGPTIFLEAINPEKPFKWRKSLTPFWEKELNRLRSEGHTVKDNGKEYEFTYTAETVRATQLYRTLPHEIGHYVDYKNKMSNFSKKTDVDKEVFAHRYADEFRNRLIAEGLILGGQP